MIVEGLRSRVDMKEAFRGGRKDGTSYSAPLNWSTAPMIPPTCFSTVMQIIDVSPATTLTLCGVVATGVSVHAHEADIGKAKVDC